jgi:hypothetical protein
MQEEVNLQDKIHELLNSIGELNNQEYYVANKLLCCVLEIAKNNGGMFHFWQSGYFWEKMDRALAEIGYEAVETKKN